MKKNPIQVEPYVSYGTNITDSVACQHMIISSYMKILFDLSFVISTQADGTSEVPSSLTPKKLEDKTLETDFFTKRGAFTEFDEALEIDDEVEWTKSVWIRDILGRSSKVRLLFH